MPIINQTTRNQNNTNNTQPMPRENPKVYASIPYVKGVSERIRRILNRENIKTDFKPLKTLSNVFKKRKDRPTKDRVQSELQNVLITYIGENNRSLKSRGELNTSLERMRMLAPR